MKKIETELCCYSIEGVKTALQTGVTRVELCAGAPEGGTTPSWAAIEMAVGLAKTRSPQLEISVMVRPRGGDFLYSQDEFEQMRRDVVKAREMGVHGVVFGILTPHGKVDVARTKELVELAKPAESTFHRAVDVAIDPVEAVDEIIAAGCRRILTSGGRKTALEGLQTIEKMVAKAAGRIEIMAGSGVNPDNGSKIAKTGVDALHFSAKATRDSEMTYRSELVSFAPAGGSDFEIAFADPDFARAMVEIATAATTAFATK